MSKKRCAIQSVLSGIFALIAASPGAAAEFLPLCGGSFVNWNDDAQVRVSTISFPAGNVFRDDLFVALNRWNNMRGMFFEFDPVDDTGGFSIGNGRNEIEQTKWGQIFTIVVSPVVSP